MDTKVIICLEQVSKIYFQRKKNKRKTVDALSKLSLEIKEGEVLGLIGPNGAGKTSAIKIIMGLSFPTSGKVWVFGLPPGSKAANRNIGYIAEMAYYYPFLEANTLLRYYAKLAGVNSREIPARIAETLELVQLSSHADRRIGEFSKGMQQRLGIAQALLHAPKLLVLDEPTSGLDPIGQHEVLSILSGLRNQGISILLSSHQLAEVEGLCNNVVIIHKGKSIFHGPLTELSKLYAPSQKTAIRFTNSSSRTISLKIPGSPETVRAGETEITINNNQIDSAIDELRKEECGISAVTPLTSTLNEIFYKMIHAEDSKGEPQ